MSDETHPGDLHPWLPKHTFTTNHCTSDNKEHYSKWRVPGYSLNFSLFLVWRLRLCRNSPVVLSRFHENFEKCVCLCDCVFSGVSFQTLNWTLTPVMSIGLVPGTALAVGSVPPLLSLLKKMHPWLCLLLTGAMWVCVMTSSSLNGQPQTSLMVIISKKVVLDLYYIPLTEWNQSVVL